MKKLLSTIMALVMLLSLVPMAVAEEGGAETGAVQSSSVYEVSDAAQLIWAAENYTGVVKLMKDVEIEETVIVTKAITLDMNGKKLFNTKDIWKHPGNDVEGPRSWSLVSVRKNGDLTITGNGTFEAKANDVYAIDLFNKGTRCTIEDGTFIGNVHAVYVQYGMLLVNGGTFSVQQTYTADPNKPYEFTLNCLDESYADGSAQIIVNGGSFYKFDPANNKAEGENTSFTGCVTTKNGDNYYEVTAPVAMIGEKGYATLAAAVADVHLKTDKERTQVIELLQDASGSGFGVGYAAITKNENDSYSTSGNNPVSITIKMNGHTYSMVAPTVGSKGTETNGFQFLKDSNVTFENGVIRLNSGLRCAYLFQNYANLTLKDMDVSIEGVTACESLVHSMNGKVDIIGKTSLTCGATYTWSATDKGDQKVIDVMDWNNSSYGGGTQVLVNTTGTITGKINVGFYEVEDVTASTGKSTLTIENGTFNGNFSSEAASGGYVAPTITVTGGAFSSNPSAFVADKSLEVSKGTAGQYTVSKKTNAAETSEVKLPAAGTEGTTKAKIDKGDIDTGKDLTVSSEVASVTINQKGVEAIGNNSDLTLTVKKVDQPNDANKAAYDEAIKGNDTASAIVVDIKLSAGSGNAFTQAVEGAYALVTVKYDASGKADKLKVFYLNGSVKQELTKVNDAANGEVNTFSYDDTNKEITMKLPHFSQYLITTTATTSGGNTSGGNSVIKTGAGSSAASTTQTVTTDLTPGSITKVTVDGKVVDAKYYTVSGSNVTFTAEFLKTLKNGSHTVTVENATKIAKGVFTVNNPTTAVQAPTTADAGIALYAGMAIASVMGTGVVFTSRKRKNH